MNKFNDIIFYFLITATFFLTLRNAKAADETPTPSSTSKTVDTEKADRAREFFEKGTQYAEKGLMDRAHEYWEIAASLDPRLSANGNNTDSMFWGLAEVSDTTFRTSTPGKQKKISEILSMTRLADKEKDFDSAMKYLDYADSLSPHEPQVRALRIKITLEDFKVDEKDSINPISKNYFDEAAGYYRHGKFADALQSINQAEELAPENLQILNLKNIIEEDDSNVLLSQEVQRAKQQLDDGNPEIASEILDNLLKKNPQFQPALDLQTEMKESQKRETSSEAHLTLDQADKEEKKTFF